MMGEPGGYASQLDLTGKFSMSFYICGPNFEVSVTKLTRSYG